MGSLHHRCRTRLPRRIRRPRISLRPAQRTPHRHIATRTRTLARPPRTDIRITLHRRRTHMAATRQHQPPDTHRRPLRTPTHQMHFSIRIIRSRHAAQERTHRIHTRHSSARRRTLPMLRHLLRRLRTHLESITQPHHTQRRRIQNRTTRRRLTPRKHTQPVLRTAQNIPVHRRRTHLDRTTSLDQPTRRSMQRRHYPLPLQRHRLPHTVTPRRTMA